MRAGEDMRRGLAALTLAAGLCLGGACSTRHYQKSADQEAYGVIRERSWQVDNMDPQFSIEQAPAVSFEGLPVHGEAPVFLGAEGVVEEGAWVLSLDQVLEAAIRHSRIYQNNKEQLFLSALDLSLARHQFAPLFSATANSQWSTSTEQTTDFVPDPARPGELKPVLSDNLVESHRVGASGALGVDWLIRDLGRLSVDFTTDFVRFLGDGPSSTMNSRLVGRFTRPLLRNQGYRREAESLTQAERSLLYELRDFTRFRKTFSVDIASAYYRVLGARDQARNAHMNLQGSRRSAERTRALAEEGRTTQAELGRLEQQELTTESAWVNAVRGYRRELDTFKIQLGIPVGAKVVLDDGELERLRIEHPDLEVEDAVKVALTGRLDFLNRRDQFDDAQRQVELAADGLLPQVDLAASAVIPSRPDERTGFALPDIERYSWQAGLNVDLGLDRKAERNSYRSALIRRERSARGLAELHDTVELEVRESWRTLEQARRTHEISEIGVKLAERRVEEQNLLAELGRARAQDQVDAQNDLVASLNQRTQALVGHTIARLQFWNNIGILYIKDDGQWKEPAHARSQ